jgi:hypothetical protein
VKNVSYSGASVTFYPCALVCGTTGFSPTGWSFGAGVGPDIGISGSIGGYGMAPAGCSTSAGCAVSAGVAGVSVEGSIGADGNSYGGGAWSFGAGIGCSAEFSHSWDW